MKLIIDIPQEKYEMFQTDGYAGLLDNDLYYDIKNGTPISDNATPCDLCRYNPPSSTDDNPCCMCPATERSE